MTANGKEYKLSEYPFLHTLYDLICHLNVDPRTVVVELNGKIELKELWNSIELKEEDKVELIRFIGGG